MAATEISAEKFLKTIPSPTNELATGDRCLVNLLANRATSAFIESEESSQVFISKATNELRDDRGHHPNYSIGSRLLVELSENIPLNTFVMDVVEVLNTMDVGVTFCRRCDFDDENLVSEYLLGGTEEDPYMKKQIEKNEHLYWTTNTSQICDFNIGEYPDLVNVDRDYGVISFQPNSKYNYVGNIHIGIILEAYILFALRRQDQRVPKQQSI